jgi:hypothetical protein
MIIILVINTCKQLMVLKVANLIKIYPTMTRQDVVSQLELNDGNVERAGLALAKEQMKPFFLPILSTQQHPQQQSTSLHQYSQYLNHIPQPPGIYI